LKKNKIVSTTIRLPASFNLRTEEKAAWEPAMCVSRKREAFGTTKLPGADTNVALSTL
jgi:hypothetical protein